MKDLYTFASTEEEALVLYEEVGQAYRRIFDRIGLPYVEASVLCCLVVAQLIMASGAS